MHRRTASMRLVTDGRLLGEIDQVTSMLAAARDVERYNPKGLASEVPRLERRLLELFTQSADDSLELVVEAVSADDYDELARLNPPTAEQLDEYNALLKALPFAAMSEGYPDTNPKTMAPALLAASLVTPEWSKAEVDAFWKELSRGGQKQVWDLVRKVQTEGADLPFFNAATASTNGGGVLSTTPASGESPPPTS